MDKIKKLFGDVNMSWKNVILFAIITGVYTGIVMALPFLDNTSFQDIGISYEFWVLFAVIVVVNCKKSTEAMLKCFVFFLISQPIVYLVEALLGQTPLNMGYYYYKNIWLPITFLTLPGGYIAYYCKKQNILGCIVLALGNAILAVLGLYYLITTVIEFPYHLLSAIFCFATIFVMSNLIQEKKKYKIIAIVLPFVLMIIGVIIIKMMGLYIVSDLF